MLPEKEKEKEIEKDVDVDNVAWNITVDENEDPFATCTIYTAHLLKTKKESKESQIDAR